MIYGFLIAVIAYDKNKVTSNNTNKTFSVKSALILAIVIAKMVAAG